MQDSGASVPREWESVSRHCRTNSLFDNRI